MKFLIPFLLILVACGHTETSKNPVGSTLNYVIDSNQQHANTGVTFDSTRNQMIHAIYDFETSSQFLKFTDMDNNEVRTLSLDSIRFAQGLAYEAKTDAIWVWGTKLNVPFQEWTDCFEIVVIDQKGNVIDRFDTPIADAYPGMISLSEGNVWLKANTQNIARLYDVRDGFRLIETVDTQVGGEGVAIDGNILWAHGGKWIDGKESRDCKLSALDLTTGITKFIPSPSPRCGSEGLVVDGLNRLWITTDDGYHFGDVGGNQAWVMPQ